MRQVDCFFKFDEHLILSAASLKGAHGMVNSLLEEGFGSLTMQVLGRSKSFLRPSQSPMRKGSKRMLQWLIVLPACWMREFAREDGAFQLFAERRRPERTPLLNKLMEQLASTTSAATLSRSEIVLGAEVSWPAR